MEPLETDGGLQMAGDQDTLAELAVVATLKQLFTGLRVGLPSLEIRCCSCGIAMRDGDDVSVYAYRTVESPRWHLARCRCPECAPNEITAPTLGATEVRVRARLAVVSDTGTQQHRLCLSDPKIMALVPPTAGTSP